MPRCAGKGFECCDSCLNGEYDPYECEDCEDGSNWEGADESKALTVHDLKDIIFLQAA
jgi:hypothetical protein